MPRIIPALQPEQLEVLQLAEEDEVSEGHPVARDEFATRLVQLLLQGLHYLYLLDGIMYCRI